MVALTWSVLFHLLPRTSYELTSNRLSRRLNLVYCPTMTFFWPPASRVSWMRFVHANWLFPCHLLWPNTSSQYILIPEVHVYTRTPYIENTRITTDRSWPGHADPGIHGSERISPHSGYSAHRRAVTSTTTVDVKLPDPVAPSQCHSSKVALLRSAISLVSHSGPIPHAESSIPSPQHSLHQF